MIILERSTSMGGTADKRPQMGKGGRRKMGAIHSTVGIARSEQLVGHALLGNTLMLSTAAQHLTLG
jgi:hypothetical protein